MLEYLIMQVVLHFLFGWHIVSEPYAREHRRPFVQSGTTKGTKATEGLLGWAGHLSIYSLRSAACRVF